MSKLTSFNTTNQPFLTHLSVSKTAHVIITAETPDFDDSVLSAWRAEGFAVQYIPLGSDGPAAYTRRLHAAADAATGLNDTWSLVAFGDAAAACLESHHRKSVPRLVALIAYYPSSLPDPARTTYPPGLSVLVHLPAHSTVSVVRTPEILGIQGKRRKTVSKRVDGGVVGIGGRIVNLAVPTYTYPGVEAGWAERDLDEFDDVAERLAWSRSLGTVRRASGCVGAELDLEAARDMHHKGKKTRDGNDDDDGEAGSAEATLLCLPTLVGGSTPHHQLQEFYAKNFSPSPEELGARLLSRTIGVDRVVDELSLGFTHDRNVDWLLPRVPLTNKRVQVVIVVVVAVRGGRMCSERVYWDQAGVLVQLGLLDPALVSGGMKESGVKRLPVVSGREGVRAVVGGGQDMPDLNRLMLRDNDRE